MSRLLDEQWRQPLSPTYVRNTAAIEGLVASIRNKESLIELAGGPGTGKTTLLKYLHVEHSSLFPGTVEYFHGSPSFPLMNAIDAIAEAFSSSKGHSLLIVDQAEVMDKGDLLEGINRLSTGPWSFTTILATRMPLGIGQAIHVNPLAFEDMGRLFEYQLGQALSDDARRALWAASQGIPHLAEILGAAWHAGRVENLEALADLLNPLEVPGLIDAQGRPLKSESHEEQTIISDVRFVSDAMLKAVGDDPNLVHALNPHEFEQLSAELFQRQGYTVTMTSRTRDGGKDLYLAKADGFGSFLYIVECKHYAPDNPVGVGIVRSLYGTAQHERVTAAMTLTTSYFSKDAEKFAREVQYQLQLKDFIDLKQMLAPHRRNER